MCRKKGAARRSQPRRVARNEPTAYPRETARTERDRADTPPHAPRRPLPPRHPSQRPEPTRDHAMHPRCPERNDARHPRRPTPERHRPNTACPEPRHAHVTSAPHADDASTAHPRTTEQERPTDENHERSRSRDSRHETPPSEKEDDRQNCRRPTLPCHTSANLGGPHGVRRELVDRKDKRDSPEAHAAGGHPR